MDTNDVPFDTIQRIQSQLQSGESIRWASPANPRVAALAGIGIFLFAIPWTAFAIFWICGAAGFKIPNFKSPASLFPLFGLPFVLVGLFMLASPIFLWRKAKKTFYLITDRRAVIFEDSRIMKLQSFGPDRLQSIERTQSADGSGSIIFGDTLSSEPLNRQRTVKTGFIGIKNVKEVEDLLTALVSKKAY
jgi:hypothetical protein